MDDVKKYKIFLDKREDGIRDRNGHIRDINESDFFITVPIFKNIELDDYVNVEIDPLRVTVERQEINPYFIEFGFFENIVSTISIEKKSSIYNIDINE